MAFLAQEIIRRKRDGQKLDASEIGAFMAALTREDIEDSQVAAFAMAVYFQGLDDEETTALTLAMADSGTRLSWPESDRPILDKHSTGGIGDKVSLILAPLLAACGAAVPMIAGRGLGHTGGTLDKLDSIPGYTTQPSLQAFQAAVNSVHCAIVGQTADLAPADKRLYAIRDVTATVESIPLITASILSKKMAAGLQGLVMDVKVGNGAFMTEKADAESLARALVTTGKQSGLPVRVLLTDMNQPLGLTAGNALEVRECIDFLTAARREARLEEVVLALGTELLEMGGLQPECMAARKALKRALDNGEAAQRFARMVEALGGPTDLLERPDRYLAAAPVLLPVPAPSKGYIAGFDTRNLGLAVTALGGGRGRSGDKIDYRVGFCSIKPLGSEVAPGEPLAMVAAANEDAARTAIRDYLEAVEISEGSPVIPPLISGTIQP